MTETDNQQIMRWTPDGFDTLLKLSEERPELWSSEKTDFRRILSESLGPGNFEEPAPEIKATGPLTMPAREPGKPVPRMDQGALNFLDHLDGITPERMADPDLLAWLSCVKLLEFGIERWPKPGNEAREKEHIRLHYLSRTTNSMTKWSVAGRTLWISHTARKAAEHSAGGFAAEEALAHFASNAEHYHQCAEYNIMRSPTVLAEYVRTLLREEQSFRKDDARAIARSGNRAAGALILDSLSRNEIRKIFESSAKKIRDRRRKKQVNVLSLGAGVQSTVMALMAEQEYEGFEKPDLAIFADTGWEPKAVYDHLDWLEQQLSYPLVRVSNGNIRESILTGKNPEGRKFLDLPVHVIKPDGKNYVGTRQCTKQYKLKPIYRYLRDEHLKAPRGKAIRDAEVLMWLGISRDEAGRQKPSREPWVKNVYPLLDRDYSREQLAGWFKSRYPERHLPKSACIGCPYHSDAAWLKMKQEDPESWKDAVKIDWALRNVPQAKGSIEGEAYLHRSRQALDEVDFSKEKQKREQYEGMPEECEGMCGI